MLLSLLSVQNCVHHKSIAMKSIYSILLAIATVLVGAQVQDARIPHEMPDRDVVSR